MERMASAARPPALRTTWMSPMSTPRAFSGWMRAAGVVGRQKVETIKLGRSQAGWQGGSTRGRRVAAGVCWHGVPAGRGGRRPSEEPALSGGRAGGSMPISPSMQVRRRALRAGGKGLSPSLKEAANCAFFSLKSS
jgi:hypothetical protein